MKKLVIAALLVSLLSLSAPAGAQESEVLCRLVERDGVICVFEETGEGYSTGIPVKFLPADDQDRLRVGITVKSGGELLQLLEDFGS